MTDVIAIFARAPIPGKVKTRLAGAIGAEAAASLYAAMLRDTLSLAKQARSEVSVVYTPQDAFDPGPYSLRQYWQGARQPQINGDLGDRMLACIGQLQAAGAEQVVLIGSDSPDLPSSFIDEAFTVLHRSQLVVGPATDGGFYLLGAAGLVPDELLQGVAWSTASTLSQVTANARRLGQSLEVLPQWNDVDTIKDLQRLIEQEKTGCLDAPHTARWLRANGLFENI